MMGYLTIVLAAAAAMLTCAVGDRIRVGDKDGWAQNVNYTEWAANHRFYVGDWLYFIFDKRYYTVLEVNKSSYINCNDKDFIYNITRGGRDVYNLTEARPYYFLSSGGYCWHGMKLAINVEQQPIHPPNPSQSPHKNGAFTRGNNGNMFITVLFLTSTIWAFFLRML
ncbi:hypothetical protein RD792_016830 [Penstemon davidsonii]|uniref:Phytocyanin domain-containing protein n=1 Tax=Penstemon davidsonii TaxID=160366 RepID=A0ABR0CKK5_9LAMI|nr:hypothetical protein RD792_016830 [Penstemon davidsonii]